MRAPPQQAAFALAGGLLGYGALRAAARFNELPKRPPGRELASIAHMHERDAGIRHDLSRVIDIFLVEEKRDGPPIDQRVLLHFVR
jgi:hypothetical protein